MAHRRSRRTVQIYPNAETLNELKARLPIFQPHDVTSVLELPTSKAKEEADRVTAAVIDGQLDQLLNALGVGRSTANCWRRGFQLLAMIHYGTGHFVFDKRRQPKVGTSSSTTEQDHLLHEFVREFAKEGVKPTVALRKIAADPKKWQRLSLSSSSRLETSGTRLRYEALRKRWTKISKMAPPGSLLAAIVGNYPVNGSRKDKANWRPNRTELPLLNPLGKSTAS